MSYLNTTKSFEDGTLWLMHAVTKRRHRTAKRYGVIFRKTSVVNRDMKNHYDELHEFWQGWPNNNAVLTLQTPN